MGENYYNYGSNNSLISSSDAAHINEDVNIGAGLELAYCFVLFLILFGIFAFRLVLQSCRKICRLCNLEFSGAGALALMWIGPFHGRGESSPTLSLSSQDDSCHLIRITVPSPSQSLTPPGNVSEICTGPQTLQY